MIATMMIRSLIVDDEPLARKRVASLLRDMPDVSLVGEGRSGREAIELIRATLPDLVFLDIQMPEIGGFEVVQAIGLEQMPAIIFTTAYDQHALKAFEFHALDYLLKPYSRQRFVESVRRACERISHANGGDMNSRLAALIDKLQTQTNHLSRFTIRASGRIFLVSAEEVDWIESAANYALLHCGAQTHVVRETMHALEKKLCPKSFQRISRSAIVNLARIKELQPMGKGEYVVILDSGKRLAMSRGIRDLERSLDAV